MCGMYVCVMCVCMVCVCMCVGVVCVYMVCVCACVSLYTAIVFVTIKNESSRQLLGHFTGFIPISARSYAEEFPLHPA